MWIAHVAHAVSNDVEPVGFSTAEIRRILQHAPVPPASPDPTNAEFESSDAAALGKLLFFEPRLSANGRISCATCHDPAQAFSDGKRLATGLKTGERNTPTLLNVAQQQWYFWDGRADSLWAQALQPLEGPSEMGGSRVFIARLLHGDAVLHAAYVKAFGVIADMSDERRFPPDARPAPLRIVQGEIAAGTADAADAAWRAMTAQDQQTVNRVFSQVGKAIAAYERSLVSDDAPFDRFAAAMRSGDQDAARKAMPVAAQRGLKLFIGKAGCRNCHFGPAFSDGEFHDTRIRPLDPNSAFDPGRYLGLDLLRADEFNASGLYSDQPGGAAADRLRRTPRTPELWGLFRTPSLRNVSLTSPYMHQGQLETLRDVLEHYSTLSNARPLGHHARENMLQPLSLAADEIDDLEAFLHALTGDAARTATTPERR